MSTRIYSPPSEDRRNVAVNIYVIAERIYAELFGEAAPVHPQAVRPDFSAWWLGPEPPQAPPLVKVRVLAAYAPQAQAEHWQAQAVRKSIELDRRLEVLEGRDSYVTASLDALRREISSLLSLAKSALFQPARPRRAELTVVRSYPVREILSARGGWEFDPDAVAMDLLGSKTLAGWRKTIPVGSPALEAEISWLVAQGWQVELPDRSAAGAVGQVFDALALGRPDLLDVDLRLDSLAEASAACEAARLARVERRRLQALRIAEDEAAAAKLATLVIDRPAQTGPIDDAGQTYDWRARARDGRVVLGIIADGEWLGVRILRPDGALLPVPATGEDWQAKLGRMARATLDYELQTPPPRIDAATMDRLAAAAAEDGGA